MGEDNIKVQRTEFTNKIKKKETQVVRTLACCFWEYPLAIRSMGKLAPSRVKIQWLFCPPWKWFDATTVHSRLLTVVTWDRESTHWDTINFPTGASFFLYRCVRATARPFSLEKLSRSLHNRRREEILYIFRLSQLPNWSGARMLLLYNNSQSFHYKVQ